MTHLGNGDYSINNDLPLGRSRDQDVIDSIPIVHSSSYK